MEIKEESGLTPLDMAVMQGHTKTTRLLISHPASREKAMSSGLDGGNSRGKGREARLGPASSSSYDGSHLGGIAVVCVEMI